jgi:hypothetical protein
MVPASDPHRRLTPPALFQPDQVRGKTLYDVLVIVLGTGTILLMAAYAELCERI